MKKNLVALVMCLLSVVALAQPRVEKKGQPSLLPPPNRYTVKFESQHGEVFSVFVDGNLMNRMPQGRVLVNDLSDQTHEVVVVLKRPAEKAAVLQLRPSEPNVIVNVNFDPRLEQLLLYTPSHNRAETYKEDVLAGIHERMPQRNPLRKPQFKPGKEPQGEATLNNPESSETKIVSDEQVVAMVARMKAQSFDSDRLALGKVIVASSNLTAVQISRLAETIDYANSQVEFLKYAYHYCVDPINYYKTTDVLTFSSDKKKVLDYIATQK